MEYRYNPKDGTFHTFITSWDYIAAFHQMDWSHMNIGEVWNESVAAEDFVFLCEMGITPDLSIKEK